MKSVRLPTFSPVWSAVVVGGLVAVMAVAGSVFVRHSIEQRSELVFANRAEDARVSIARRLDAYTEALYAGHGLVAGSEVLTRAEFHRFVEHLQIPGRYPGIQVLGRAEYVEREGLDDLIARTREDVDQSGLPYGDFELKPNEVRDDYVIIDYTEPQAGNEASFGLDLFSEPTRRDAVERARDTGKLAATAPVTLVQETGSQRGFLMMLADYDSDFPPSDVDGRREDFRAVEYAAFRMGDLMEGVLSRTDEFEFEVYDVGLADAALESRPTVEQMMYSLNDTRFGVDGLPAEGDSAMLPLNVGGRRWALYFSSAGNTIAPLDAALPWMVLGLGLLFACLVGWVIRSNTRSKVRAVELAERMTEDLQRSKQELSQSNNELQRFAYVASNDLQEPIRTITNFVGLLKRNYAGQLDDKADGYIEFTVDAAARMSMLISDLLAFSRVGRQDRETQPVDLEELWDGVVADHQAKIIDANAVIGTGPLPTVIADRVYMNQLFTNLLGNALKYGARAVMVDAAETTEGWRISVQDDGIGIDPAHHDRIFEMFQRLHTRSEYPGTGMGLAICKKIVEGYGGTIEVSSSSGEGSTFIITLPSVMVEDDDHVGREVVAA